MSDKNRDTTPRPDENNRDLYRFSGDDAGRIARQQGDGGAQQRFRDEAYNPPAQYYQPQQPGYPREYHTPGRHGDHTTIVYGDVYINQSGNDYRCRRRDDGRDEYYGRGYYYNAYCRPQYNQCQPYYEYGYRQSAPQPTYYERPNGYYSYEGGGGYQYQAPTYSRDSVYGGRDGYSADRQRYNGGYERQYGGRPYYSGGCYGGGAYGGGGSYPSDWDRTSQIFDFALKGFDAYAGYDIARRYASNDRQQSRYSYQPYYNAYGGSQYRSVPYRR